MGQNLMTVVLVLERDFLGFSKPCLCTLSSGCKVKVDAPTQTIVTSIPFLIFIILKSQILLSPVLLSLGSTKGSDLWEKNCSCTTWIYCFSQTPGDPKEPEEKFP